MLETKYYSPKDAAAYLGVTYALMQKWRLHRSGPRYHRIGRLVRYNRVDLDSFMRKHSVGALEVNR